LTTEKRKPKYPFRDFQTGKIFLQGGPEIPVKQLSSEQLKRMGRSANITDMSEVDAKIAAAEARTDTKFAEMMGELRVISGKLEHLDENYRETRTSISSLKSTVIVTAVTTVLAIGGLFYTALQYGNSMFTAGLDTQTIADQSAKNALSQIQPSVDQLGTAVKNSNDRLSEIMAIFERIEKNPPAQTTPNQ